MPNDHINDTVVYESAMACAACRLDTGELNFMLPFDRLLINTKDTTFYLYGTHCVKGHIRISSNYIHEGLQRQVDYRPVPTTVST